MSSVPDQGRLIEGILRGDPEAIRVLDGWTDVVLRQCARSLQGEWNDLKQEVRARAIGNLSRHAFDGNSALRTYIHRIAKNVCIDALRSSQRRRNREMSFEGAAGAPSPTAPAEPWIARDLVHKLLEDFSDDDRTLLNLVFVEQLSYGEIAARLAIPEGTVKSRMHRCKNRIVERRRKLLGLEGDR